MNATSSPEVLFLEKATQYYGFTSDDVSDIATSETIEGLVPVASRLISSFGKTKFAIGIGPMTSGTSRTPEQNFMIFDRGYDWFRQSHGRPIFYQLVFERDIARLRRKLYHDNEPGLIKVLFEQFYKPILLHKNLDTVLLMPDWELSTGARIERSILETRQIKPTYIDMARIAGVLTG